MLGDLSWGDVSHQLGPLSSLALIGCGVALAAAGVSLWQQKAARPARSFAIVSALALLGAFCLAEAHVSLSSAAVQSTLRSVPWDHRPALELKAAQDARVWLIFVLLSAVLPAIACGLAVVRSRAWSGAILAASAVALGAHAASIVSGPLPSGRPGLAAVPGLIVPRSAARSRLTSQPRLALTPEGRFLDGAPVASFAAALAQAPTDEGVALPLIVDARVPFRSLADTLTELAPLKVDLVVRADDDALYALRVSAAGPEAPSPSLNLTLRLTADQAILSGSAAVLPAMPLEGPLLETAFRDIAASFPKEERLRVTADEAVATQTLVTALDARRGRFPLVEVRP